MSTCILPSLDNSLQTVHTKYFYNSSWNLKLYTKYARWILLKELWKLQVFLLQVVLLPSTCLTFCCKSLTCKNIRAVFFSWWRCGASTRVRCVTSYKSQLETYCELFTRKCTVVLCTCEDASVPCINTLSDITLRPTLRFSVAKVLMIIIIILCRAWNKLQWYSYKR